MKVRIYNTIEDDVYKVTMYTEDWSENDIGLMIKFDEPEVDVGGSFTDGESVPITFTLPSQLVRIRSESPLNVAFDGRDYDEPDVYAEIWSSTMLTRITSAMSTLRSHTDDFTSETVVSI